MTATFDPEPVERFTLNTSTSGPGTISPDCSLGCPYRRGDVATLTATPDPNRGAFLSGWTGCTPPTGSPTTCSVTMTEGKSSPRRSTLPSHSA